MSAFAAQPSKGYTETGVFNWLGRLSIKADATVDATKSWGKGSTFTKTGTGTYRLVLARAYCGYEATGGTIGLALTKAAASKFGMELVDKDFSTGTFNFRVTDMDSVGQPAIETTVVLELDITLRIIDSSVPKG